MRPFRILTIVLVLFLCNYVAKAANGDVSLDTVPDYNGWGWDALVVDNGIIQLLIIPDIGGRVMFYGFTGDEYLAVNEGQMGQVYDPDVNNNGPWSSWGYGGINAGLHHSHAGTGLLLRILIGEYIAM